MSGGRFRYLPALDGLRAFAVLAVLCYHGGMSWAIGGFLGVDAFFVLSGFLITSLLLVEWRGTGGIALSAFWIRRARRLLPALFLVLGGVALYAAFAAAPTELDRIRSDGLASLFYVSNWRFVFSHQSYFEQFGVPSPLRHMWSLAIEEQFYLVWPMIVYGVLRWRRGSVGALAAVAGAIGIASVVLMVTLYEPGRDPSRVVLRHRYAGLVAGRRSTARDARDKAHVREVRRRASRRSTSRAYSRSPSWATCGPPRPTARAGSTSEASSSPRSSWPWSSPTSARSSSGPSASSWRSVHCAGSVPSRTGSTCGTGRSTCSSARRARTSTTGRSSASGSPRPSSSRPSRTTWSNDRSALRPGKDGAPASSRRR